MPEQTARCCTSTRVAFESNLSIAKCVMVPLCFTNASPVISWEVVCLLGLTKCKFIQVIDNDICRHSLRKMASVKKTSSHCRKETHSYPSPMTSSHRQEGIRSTPRPRSGAHAPRPGAGEHARADQALDAQA